MAVTTGSTSVQLLRKLKRDNAPEIAEVYAKDNSEGFLLLESGRAEGFVADGQILATLISRSKEPAQYRLLDQVLSVEPIAIMIPKGDAAFKKLVDQSVLALARSGRPRESTTSGSCNPQPHGAKVGLPASALTRAAWANPSDKPMEDYEVR